MNKNEWKTIVRWATEQHKINPNFWDDFSIKKDQVISFEIKKGCCNTDWVKLTYSDIKKLKMVVKLRSFFKGLK
jgi:hypothetical protein